MGVVQMLGNGLLTMDGPEHDQHRRMMNPAFTIAYMDRYLPLMNRIIRERTADWITRGTIDIYDEARKITFDVAAEALIGLKVGAEVDQFRSLFLRLMMDDPAVTTYTQYVEKQTAINAELRAMMLPKIAERRAHPTDDVLGMMIQARDDAGNALSDDQLIGHTNILLLAGHETSTSLSAWLLYLLVENPAYLQRVLEEQNALLTPGADPSLETIKRMKVLDNALSEAERMYPSVMFGPRGTLEDVEFNGYLIPVGTLVSYQIAGSHMLPGIFKNPEQFDPDRFAPPREEDKKTPYALVGFGGGPRICIGINFAQVEIKAMASHILREFNLTVTPDQSIMLSYGVTSRPINGIRMNVTRRA